MTLQAGSFVMMKSVEQWGPEPNQDLVLTTTARRGCKYIGVMLGTYDPKRDKKKPTRDEMMALLGAVGMVGLDDIEEALGEESMKKVIEHCLEKYKVEAKNESSSDS